jgi:hypothetical protein
MTDRNLSLLFAQIFLGFAITCVILLGLAL